MKERYFTAILKWAGYISIFFGVFIVVINFAFISPKAVQFTTAVDRDLERMEDILQITRQNSALGDTLLNVGSITASLSDLLPETLMSLSGTIIQGSSALERTGSTLDAIEKGIPGIVLPRDRMARNISAIQKLSSQLRLVVGMLREMLPVVESLSLELSRLNRSSTQLRRDFQNLGEYSGELVAQIETIRSSIRPTLVRGYTFGIATFFGGIYVIFGLILLGLSKLYQELVKSQITLHTETRPLPKVQNRAS